MIDQPEPCAGNDSPLTDDIVSMELARTGLDAMFMPRVGFGVLREGDAYTLCQSLPNPRGVGGRRIVKLCTVKTGGQLRGLLAAMPAVLLRQVIDEEERHNREEHQMLTEQTAAVSGLMKDLDRLTRVVLDTKNDQPG
jgi:hypothetical protein